MSEIFGVSAALLTPFESRGAIAYSLMAKHAINVLDNGCSSITLFGTTGEGASLELNERLKAVGILQDAGIDPAQIILSIKADAIGDAIKELQAGIDMRCNSFLLSPPHFFKQVSDEGLYAWFSAILEKFSKHELKIILYNIPQLTGVTISPALAAKLFSQFPSHIYGVKDSSGNWSSAKEFLALKDDLAILIGDERFLANGAKLGAQGCISGLANFFGMELLDIIKSGTPNKAISDLVDIVVSTPIVPAIKQIAAHIFDDNRWLNVRPPLTGLTDYEQKRLLFSYNEVFTHKVGA